LRVLVFEPDFGGHHFAYLRLILPAFSELAGSVVLSTTTAALDSPQYQTLLRPLSCRVELDALPPARGALLSRSVHNLQSLARAVRRIRPDHVIVPYADGISQLLGATRPWPLISRDVHLEGLLFRGGFAYPTTSLRRRAFTRASWTLATRASWSRIHHLDPLVLEAVRRRGGTFASRCDLMPDPVEPTAPSDRVTARRRLDIPEDGRYIACIGALDRRKGVDLLIRAFAGAALRSTDRLLLVGQHEPYVSAMLREEYAPLIRQIRIVSIDRFASPSDFDAAVQSADVICTPYPAHVGSASIVIRGAAAGKFVLGSTYGWIGATIQRFKLGRVCRVGDALEFASAIKESLALAPEFSLGEGGRRFVEFHSPENFVGCWTSYARGRLGVPEAAGRRTWEWVLEALDRPAPPS
jgi:glycosyltransferase involved in cell wall biosynthesis